MTRFARHILVPALGVVAVVGVYYTPVSLIGCANRGLVAIAVVLVTLIAAVYTLYRSALLLKAGESAVWWLASTCILVLPAALVFGPLA